MASDHHLAYSQQLVTITLGVGKVKAYPATITSRLEQKCSNRLHDETSEKDTPKENLKYTKQLKRRQPLYRIKGVSPLLFDVDMHNCINNT